MKKLLLLIATSIIMTSTVLAEDSMLDKFEKIMEEKYEQEQEKADEQYENENFSGKRNILYKELMQNVREQQRKTSHISGEVDYDIAVTMSGKSLNNPENDVNEMVLDFSGNAKFAAQEDGTWMAKSSNGNITSELVLGIPSEVYANIKNGKMTIFYYFDADETWHQSVFNVNVDFIYDFSDSYPDFIKYANENTLVTETNSAYYLEFMLSKDMIRFFFPDIDKYEQISNVLNNVFVDATIDKKTGKIKRVILKLLHPVRYSQVYSDGIIFYDINAIDAKIDFTDEAIRFSTPKGMVTSNDTNNEEKNKDVNNEIQDNKNSAFEDTESTIGSIFHSNEMNIREDEPKNDGTTTTTYTMQSEKYGHTVTYTMYDKLTQVDIYDETMSITAPDNYSEYPGVLILMTDGDVGKFLKEKAELDKSYFSDKKYDNVYISNLASGFNGNGGKIYLLKETYKNTESQSTTKEYTAFIEVEKDCYVKIVVKSNFNDRQQDVLTDEMFTEILNSITVD